MPQTTLVGPEAVALIEAQLHAHGQGLTGELAAYDAAYAVETWHAAIRAVEEFINVPRFGTIEGHVKARLRALPLGAALLSDPKPIALARAMLTPACGAALAQRFGMTMLQASAMSVAFRSHGVSLGDGFSLDTVGDAMNYFQARRRHLVSLLYTMAGVCRGQARLEPLNAFAVVLRMVELSCITITGLHQQAVLAEVYPDFTLEIDGRGFRSNRSFDALETDFLEPERASIMAMHDVRRDDIAPFETEPVDPSKIFSAAELRNTVRALRAVYDTFDVNDGAFAAVAQLTIAFTRSCEDDYYVILDAAKFRSMIAAQSSISPDVLETLLVNRPVNYAANTNAYEPFIAVGDKMISNVNLLSRFLYAFKNVHLGSRRRFQIHAGFIFEDMVKRDLDAKGLHVTGIKRINRKEFDVVAVLGDTIYNLQCKNNWVDLAKLETDRKLFARYNRALVRYYRSALSKEAKREGLLLQQLGLSKIKHLVISRFPVITDDPRIISYNRLDARVAAIVAG